MNIKKKKKVDVTKKIIGRLLSFKNGKQNFKSNAAKLEILFTNNKNKSNIKIKINTGNNPKNI